MHENRIRNVFLAIIATLLLLNLGVMLLPAAHALPKTQYKAVAGYDRSTIQPPLDEQSAQGWEYVGSSSGFLIFKK